MLRVSWQSLDVANVTVPMPPPPSQRGRSREPHGSSSTTWIWETFFCNASLFCSSVLVFLRGRLRFCFFVALRECHRAQLATDSVVESRAWKLFGLVPIMLLHRPGHTGSVGRDELFHRADEAVRQRQVGRFVERCPRTMQSVNPGGHPTWSR